MPLASTIPSSHPTARRRHGSPSSKRESISAQGCFESAVSRQILAAQERERENLARELHDEMGQILTGLKLAVASARYLPPKDLPRELRALEHELDQLIGRIQEMSLDLHPRSLKRSGLNAALRQHVARFTTRTGQLVRLQVSGLDRHKPSRAAQAAAFRIVQEALTNAARHARSKEPVEVTVLASSGGLAIEIRDRGKGFNVKVESAKQRAIGLQSMRDRAKLLGGQLEIDSTPHQGTTIRATLPL